MATRRLKRLGHTDDRPGWVIGDNACITCESCTRGRLGPNSASWDASRLQPGESSDSPEHCDNCGVLLTSTSLTSDGVEYTINAIREYTGDPKVLELWRTEFKDYFEGPEHYGVTIRALLSCPQLIQDAFPGLRGIPECYAAWDIDYDFLVAGNNLNTIINLCNNIADGELKVPATRIALVFVPITEKLKKKL